MWPDVRHKVGMDRCEKLSRHGPMLEIKKTWPDVKNKMDMARYEK